VSPTTSGGHCPDVPPSRAAQVRIPAQRTPLDDLLDDPVSAAVLLRREGQRVPHAADRPSRRRAHQLRGRSDSWAEAGGARRASVAAGALVAAASVIGAAVLIDNRGPVERPVAAPDGPPDRAADPTGGATGFTRTLLGPLEPGAQPVDDEPLLFTHGLGQPSGPPAPPPPGVEPPGTAPLLPRAAQAASRPATVERTVGQVVGPVRSVTDTVGRAAPGEGGKTVSGLGTTVHDTTDELGGAVDGLLGGHDRRRSNGARGSRSVDRIVDSALGTLGSGGTSDTFLGSALGMLDSGGTSERRHGDGGKSIGRSAADLLEDD